MLSVASFHDNNLSISDSATSIQQDNIENSSESDHEFSDYYQSDSENSNNSNGVAGFQQINYIPELEPSPDNNINLPDPNQYSDLCFHKDPSAVIYSAGGIEQLNLGNCRPDALIPVIRDLLWKGLTQRQIRTVLYVTFKLHVSLRQLRRFILQANLGRNSSEFALKSDAEIEILIGSLQNTYASQWGYRYLNNYFRLNNGIRTTNRQLMEINKRVNPRAVEERVARRLNRRKFFSPGPNFSWHVDQHDKLKPYGYGLHACVDGFSRYVLWCEILPHNTAAAPIAYLFLKTVLKYQGCPRLIRTDFGSENSGISRAQRFLRWNDADNNAGSRSHRYGSSPKNQRCEAFWSRISQSWGGWWRNYFSDLMDEGFLIMKDKLIKNLSYLVHLKILKNSLAWFVRTYNAHTMRKTNYSRCPAGKPELLFTQPEIFNTRENQYHNYLVPLQDVRRLNYCYSQEVANCDRSMFLWMDEEEYNIATSVLAYWAEIYGMDTEFNEHNCRQKFIHLSNFVQAYRQRIAEHLGLDLEEIVE